MVAFYQHHEFALPSLVFSHEVQHLMSSAAADVTIAIKGVKGAAARVLFVACSLRRALCTLACSLHLAVFTRQSLNRRPGKILKRNSKFGNVFRFHPFAFDRSSRSLCSWSSRFFELRVNERQARDCPCSADAALYFPLPPTIIACFIYPSTDVAIR